MSEQQPVDLHVAIEHVRADERLERDRRTRERLEQADRLGEALQRRVG